MQHAHAKISQYLFCFVFLSERILGNNLHYSYTCIIKFVVTENMTKNVVLFVMMDLTRIVNICIYVIKS